MNLIHKLQLLEYLKTFQGSNFNREQYSIVKAKAKEVLPTLSVPFELGFMEYLKGVYNHIKERFYHPSNIVGGRLDYDLEERRSLLDSFFNHIEKADKDPSMRLYHLECLFCLSNGLDTHIELFFPIGFVTFEFRAEMSVFFFHYRKLTEIVEGLSSDLEPLMETSISSIYQRLAA